MTPADTSLRHLPTVTPDMGAAEYVQQITATRKEAQPKQSFLDRTLYPVFNWIGDAMLAVPPINRLCCAIGLTVGLLTFSNISKFLSGRKFDGTLINPNEAFRGMGVKTPLKHVYGVMGYDPHSDKWQDSAKKLFQFGLYSTGGALGVIAGTKAAYFSGYRKNHDPEYIEDFSARVSQEHGDKWMPLTAFSSTFGSAAGTSLIPIPGINYALSLEARTLLEQDSKIMLPPMHGIASNTPTSSRLGIRAGLTDLIQYAAGNPAEVPLLLEIKSYHILGQIFEAKDVKASHIQEFVDKIHTIRDKYYQEGGVPRAQQAALKKELEAHFTKAGLEDTLLEIGLNPRMHRLAGQNGTVGKIGNVLGASKPIAKLMEDLEQKLLSRHPDLPSDTLYLTKKSAANEAVASPAPQSTPSPEASPEAATSRYKFSRRPSSSASVTPRSSFSDSYRREQEQQEDKVVGIRQ
jgi:hypothetical protein